MTNAQYANVVPVTPLIDPIWATNIAGRSPSWKPHSNIGMAKNAMYGRHGALYEKIGDQWVKRVEVHYGGYGNAYRDQLRAVLKAIKPTEEGTPVVAIYVTPKDEDDD